LLKHPAAQANIFKPLGMTSTTWEPSDLIGFLTAIVRLSTCSPETAAIATDPKDPDGYRRRAQAHIMAGDSQKAAEDFKAILKMKPDDVDAQSRLKALETRANASPTPPSSTPATSPGTSPAKAPSMAPPAASPR
jgi:CubicO group peptidase (beta-lactamase class C family)